MRALRVVSIALLAGIFGLILYTGWQRHEPNQTEVAFNTGGKIAFDLSAGGYKIMGTAENKIRVELEAGESRYVHSQMSTNGNNAKVVIEGPSNNFHATIYVPQRSDIEVDQTIGELVVTNVEGNKKLGVNIGRIEVQVPGSGPQPSFDGSVIIGALRAPTWHVEKGGFFRSFTMHSSEPYSINAHVDIGDLEVSAVGAQAGQSHPQKSDDAHNDVSKKDSDNNSE